MEDGSRKTESGARIGGTARAFVHTRSREIGYTRSGHGTPVLLIAADASVREPLRAELARRFMVIAPDLTDLDPGMSRAAWLCMLIDSLGLVRPHLVVTDPHCPAALHFALSDADRVDRIAILWNDEKTDGLPDRGDPLEDRLWSSGHPLLLVRLPMHRARVEAACAESFDALTRYLSTAAE